MSKTPKPPVRINPDTVIDQVNELEREEQIAALEQVHSELTTRLSRTQA
ncbi:MAG: hypothetical protein GX483_07445 [Actinomycetaceae bacterium]|nr:hypothetical protein [Actinomycetaceae bacterium]